MNLGWWQMQIVFILVTVKAGKELGWVNALDLEINLNPSEPDPACETLSQGRYQLRQSLLREDSVLVACTCSPTWSVVGDVGNFNDGACPKHFGRLPRH
jgi:hypothetical protein